MASSAAVALALSTPISPLPNHLGGMPLPVSAVPKAIYAAFLLFVLAFAAMALFYRARELARRVTLSVLGVVSLRFAQFATATLERLADASDDADTRAASWQAAARARERSGSGEPQPETLALWNRVVEARLAPDEQRDDRARGQEGLHHVSLIPITGRIGMPVMYPRCVKVVL